MSIKYFLLRKNLRKVISNRRLYYFFGDVCLFGGCGSRNQTQGLTYVKQTFCHALHLPVPVLILKGKMKTDSLKTISKE